MKKAKILAVNISLKKGTIKTAKSKIELSNAGIDGDAHAGDWHRQVSLLAIESIVRHQLFSKEEYVPGVYAENITTEGMEIHQLSLGEHLTCGPVILEVTQIGKECHGTGCAIFTAVGKCVMPKEGIFCKVLRNGSISANDEILYLPNN